jgi:DNA gyrase/topoisomerase IV subunit B
MNERDIKTISFGRACRDRIGMYLSADREEALALGLREIYVNSLDALTETKQRNGKIEIRLDSMAKTIKVSDNGPGIPNKMREDGVHSLVAAFTMPHTGSHFDEREVNSIGLNGIGASVVTHTAKKMIIRSNDGKVNTEASFNESDNGAVLEHCKDLKSGGLKGVEVQYQVSDKIYGDVWFDTETLKDSLSEMMKFYPNVEVVLIDDGRPTSFKYPNGLKDTNTKVYYESDNLILSLGLGGGDIKPFGNRLHLPHKQSSTYNTFHPFR